MGEENLKEQIYDIASRKLDNDIIIQYNRLKTKNNELEIYILASELAKLLKLYKRYNLVDYSATIINKIFYKINLLFIKDRNIKLEESIEHMMYMLKTERYILNKLISGLKNTDENDILDIYLCYNIVVELIKQATFDCQNLLRKDECELKGISYIFGNNIGIKENEIDIEKVYMHVKKMK